jgi:hypothetical protein
MNMDSSRARDDQRKQRPAALAGSSEHGQQGAGSKRLERNGGPDRSGPHAQIFDLVWKNFATT